MAPSRVVSGGDRAPAADCAKKAQVATETTSKNLSFLGERMPHGIEVLGRSQVDHRAVCASATATSTSAPPASCTPLSDSPSQAAATSVATTGSSIATSPA